MAREGLHALFVTDPSNMAWLTGYDGWSFYVHQGVLLGHEGDPVRWGRRVDGFGAKRTVWMDDDHVADYPDDYIQSGERHPMQAPADLMAGRGLAAGRIGVEMENYDVTARAMDVLRTEMPQATFRDATNLCNWQRMSNPPMSSTPCARPARSAPG